MIYGAHWGGAFWLFGEIKKETSIGMEQAVLKVETAFESVSVVKLGNFIMGSKNL